MKNLILLLLISLFSTGHILSQSLSLVASNPAGETKIVHTLKLSNTNSPNTSFDDTSISHITRENQAFISYLESKMEVQRATFDHKTSTFTILSNQGFDITSILNYYNQPKK